MKTGSVLLFSFLTPLFWAQDKKEIIEYTAVSHTVVSGETILNISKQYGVDPSVVYRNNRFALDSIKQGMVLTFPSPKTTALSNDQAVVKLNEATVAELILDAPNTEAKEFTPSKLTESDGFHKVLAGETLYGLSKEYVCTVEELKKLNPQLSQSALQIGQVLAIPVRGAVVKSSSYKSGETIKHVVQPKETLYGLSKKYGVSIAAIQKQNQAILKRGLQVDQILLITVN
jgi:LysM repeat protein